ncbi:MAG: hypothetical protein JNM93_04005 [Bacteriovoracaceae bacterium]|nr:hypothetical protein [Bacteriovoracaceae bacterium]
MLQQLKESNRWQKVISWFSLFSSFGTILCCALPSAFVLLGLGSTLASFLGTFPQLIWLSENKGLVFGLSFFFLGLSFFAQRYAAKMTCPIDKKEACTETKNWSKPLLWISLAINSIGVLYAYILPQLFS